MHEHSVNNPGNPLLLAFRDRGVAVLYMGDLVAPLAIGISVADCGMLLLSYTEVKGKNRYSANAYTGCGSYVSS